MASFAVGTFFFRYWRATKDRLFLMFCVAFWLLGLNWLLASMAAALATNAHVFRFLAFVVIAYAMLDKNRRRNDQACQIVTHRTPRNSSSRAFRTHHDARAVRA